MGDEEEPPKTASPEKFEPPPRGAAKAPEKGERVVTKNSMEELELNRMQDVETMVELVVPKVKNAKAKQASSKFLSDALHALQGKLTLAEAEQLQKTIKGFVAERKKQEAEAKKKKLQEEEKKKQDDADFFSAFL